MNVSVHRYAKYWVS